MIVAQREATTVVGMKVAAGTGSVNRPPSATAERFVSILSVVNGQCELTHLDLRSQLFVGQAFVSNGSDKGIEPQKGMTLHVSNVQPESELVNVAMQVFLAGVMIDAMKAALQDSPNRLDAVSGDVPTSPLAFGMVNGTVLEEQTAYAGIRAVFVSVQGRTDFAELVDRALDDRQVVGFDNKSFRVAAALAHSKNRSLTDRAASLFQFLIFVLAAFQTADKSLIDFDDATQLVNVRSARFAETLQHEPSRLLSHADLFRQLQGTNALPRRDEQIHRINPLVQGNMRPLKDSARPDREILFTGVAAIEATLASRDAFRAFADRTNDAIRPQAGFQVETSRYRVGNHLKQLKGGYCASTHAENLPRINRGSQVYNSQMLRKEIYDRRAKAIGR